MPTRPPPLPCPTLRKGRKMPTGPQPQRPPPVAAGHKCPRGPNHTASFPSQRVTNAYGATVPAHSARHNDSEVPAGPQPQRAPPVAAGHKCPRGPSHSASLPSQRVTNAYGAQVPAHSARHNDPQVPPGPQPQRAPPVAAGHKCPRGPSHSASLPSQRVTNAYGAQVPAHSARHNDSHVPAGPQPQRAPPVAAERGPRQRGPPRQR